MENQAAVFSSTLRHEPARDDGDDSLTVDLWVQPRDNRPRVVALGAEDQGREDVVAGGEGEVLDQARPHGLALLKTTRHAGRRPRSRDAQAKGI